MSAGSLSEWPFRAIGFALRIPRQLIFQAHQRRLQRWCNLGADAQLLTGCKLLNYRSDPSLITIGSGSRVGAELMVFGHGGRITIGSNCFVGEGTRIWSSNEVRIGNNVLISHDVNIHDTNSHSMSAARRRQHVSDIFHSGHPAFLPDVPDSAVVIEDDAWIGFNSTVLKGVRIGRGAVVGACSVITKDVPAFTVVVGSPARVVGRSKP